MFDKTLVVLDIETTGTLPGHHEIIEIGAVKVRKGKITDQYQTLVRPKHEIPLFIQNLTGLNSQMTAKAPHPEEALADLKKFIGRSIIAGHNIEFDMAFINSYLKTPLKNQTIDTCRLARIFWPMMKSHSLSHLAEKLQIAQDKRHRALDDARTAAELLNQIKKRILALEFNTIIEINRISDCQDWELKEFFASLEKKLAAQFPAGKIPAKAPGVSNAGGGIFGDGKAQKPPEMPVQLDYRHIKDLLKPGGILSREFPGYEYRAQQEKLMLDICRSFNEHKILLMEAGTGSGKSLAYLIPSIYWSAYNGEKVVIATHTINLQEQLWEKEIPLIRKILNIDFQAALVKGRNNYLCLRKWHDALDCSYDFEEMLFHLRLLIWLNATETGDKSELRLHQTEREIWETVAADSDTCLGSKCPWFDRYCFAINARRRAENADLLVINHSLLFSDIKTENRLLPPYSLLVVDEAHHLEDGATEHLGTEVSTSDLKRLLNMLYRSRQDSNPGLLSIIKNKLDKYLYAFDSNDFHLIREEIEKAKENVRDIRDGAALFFAAVSSLGRDFYEDLQETRCTFRLREGIKSHPLWAEVENQRSNLQTRLTYLIENLKKIINILERHNPGEEDILPGEKKDLLSIIGTIKTITAAIDFILEQQEKNHVYWMECNSSFCSLKAAPVNVGEILYGNLLQNKRTIVFTSATLAVDGSFEHFIEGSGLGLLERDKLITTGIGSPFDYEKQALLCAVNDLPDPNQVDDDAFVSCIAPFLSGLFRITGGRTLVLFTAHKMLKAAYNKLKPEAEKHNINLLADGIDGSRERVLNLFREQGNSVIFGASSFWEGLDLPGDMLQCVVLVKIPFAPPTVPTVEARLEALAAKNIDGFWNYTVPQAVIRFKQGFGRLIRTQKDRGVVVILDKRIVNKKYGHKFLRSLPLKCHFKGEQDIVLDKICRWMAGDIPEVNFNLYNSRKQIEHYLKSLQKRK